jgi:hypothetical protein
LFITLLGLFCMGWAVIIYAQRMHTTIAVLSLCVCVCVCVCPLFTRRLKGLYYELNISADYTLTFQDFQCTDFDKPSFKRYSTFQLFYSFTASYMNGSILLVVWL